ncbi:low-density lipoprotein receptor class A domain-containing protein 2 [Marmota monax]|uniref:low-density lipoprotein receptor class A domain-containing protein 2 n=1 Tax=Marmota monax TaxID=9995 RepID=UPI001EAFA7C4|nr:low-density lipoprotein receptor class A domain-containing protein 2 [Marmota monax]
MAACGLLLPRRLLLLGMAALAASAPETADLVDLCGQAWRGDALLLRSHSASRKFYFVAPHTDCGFWMHAAAAGDRIRFQFHFFLVYSLTSGAGGPNSSLAPADPCAPGSYLQFYEGPPGAPRPLGPPLCGLTIPAPVASSGRSLGLRLVTRGRQPRVDFVGEVTSFRLGPCGAYFRCRNGRCIPPSLVCDPWGMDNCGDGSDQGSWPPASCRGPGLQGMALASSLLLASAGLLMGLLWCCCSLGCLAWEPGVHGLCLRRSAPCNICHMCPDRVAPGGLRQSGLAFQDRETVPREAVGVWGREWALGPDMP